MKGQSDVLSEQCAWHRPLAVFSLWRISFFPHFFVSAGEVHLGKSSEWHAAEQLQFSSAFLTCIHYSFVSISCLHKLQSATVAHRSQATVWARITQTRSIM